MWPSALATLLATALCGRTICWCSWSCVSAGCVGLTATRWPWFLLVARLGHPQEQVNVVVLHENGIALGRMRGVDRGEVVVHLQELTIDREAGCGPREAEFVAHVAAQLDDLVRWDGKTGG